MDQENTSDRVPGPCSQRGTASGLGQDSGRSLSSQAGDTNSSTSENKPSTGTSDAEDTVPPSSPAGFGPSDRSLPEVSNTSEEDLQYELQQAYRIFTGFLVDKYKGITSLFLHPIGQRDGVGGLQDRGPAQLKQSMCLRQIEEKFVSQEYETITEFVADFRLMLENCYRYHGIDHWISKQAQKLETLLEQKLTLLSRTLREKTTLAVTSKGRFGTEEDRGSSGTSTRRRSVSRYLATITGDGHESVMVQALRLEEQQRAKEEKRQRELEKKEAEEMSAKELEEWEQNLLSTASPHSVDTLWELPAIGHFLCLAQTALNLPEIIFFELERCLLMPRCSLLLSKIMSSLLSPPQRRATLHRRPALMYRRWESELRQRVMNWYRAVGSSHNQPRRAEQLGLCSEFFSILGEVNPLEEKPFHLLPFYQRVWLLKGLCDNVYETQKDVQDAVLAQPIHECRESILGYDSKDNAYIHFPHFCGADLRIYCQSPSEPPAFPFTNVLVRKVQIKADAEGDESEGVKNEVVKNDTDCDEAQMDIGEFRQTGKPACFKKEISNGGEEKALQSCSLRRYVSESDTSDGDICANPHLDLKFHSNCRNNEPVEGSCVKELSQEPVFSLGSERTIKAETLDPCLNVGEHSYTGRSPASSLSLGSPSKLLQIKTEEENFNQDLNITPCSECRKRKIGQVHFCCAVSGPVAKLSSEDARKSSEDRVKVKIWTKRKKRKKKQMREQLMGGKWENKEWAQAETTNSEIQKPSMIIKKKDKKRKRAGKNTECLKKVKDESLPGPTFKLVCSNLDELRELISRTEDELDELESMKKRLGRWYYKKEAVKELHSTLIRLLNELSPWEPKLVKAYQRNRLRLKKEFDDFKKHPEYNNFVREEFVSSPSSSEDVDDDIYEERGESEEEDQEHLVPRGLWSGASTREVFAEPALEKTQNFGSPNHLKPLQSSKEKALGLQPGVQDVATKISVSKACSDIISKNKANDSGWETGTAGRSSVPPTPSSVDCSVPKSYTPIPTFLAKSVGNKVTLTKRPNDLACVISVDGQSKRSSLTPNASTETNPNISTTQSAPSRYLQNSQRAITGEPKLMRAPEQSALVTDTFTSSSLAKPSNTQPNSPVQMLCKMPGGFAHLVRKDCSSPVRLSAPSAMNQVIAEKLVQPAAVGPSNLTTHLHETSCFQNTASTVATPICISTDVPGFSIPVHQVPPPKDARMQVNANVKGVVKTPGCKASVQPSTPKGAALTSSSITAPARSLPAETDRNTELKQELKTVCVRDSQSILVTTRGGNTGIVKVQTSSDQNSLGSFSSSPVITISPQLKAFLISRTSGSLSPSGSSPSSSAALIETSASKTQTQKPCDPNSTVTSSIPAPDVARPTKMFPPLSYSSNISLDSTLETNASKLLYSLNSGCSPTASVLKNTAVVPSLRNTGVLDRPMQESIRQSGVKRAHTEAARVTKYSLTTPSSSSASSPSQCTASSANASVGSGVLLSTKSTATVPSTLVGTGQILNTSLSSQALKTDSSPAKAVPGVVSETLSKSGLHSGFTIPLLGKTTTIGQSIGALSDSPLKALPVPTSFSPTAASSNRSVPLPTLQQPDAKENTIKNNTMVPKAPSRSSPAQVCPAAGGGTAQITPSHADFKSSKSKSGPSEEVSSLQPSFQAAGIKAQTAGTTCGPSATSTAGSVQQRIIINTSTHLTAGTQIFLNNTRFVVPPQGLVPGSHVLIISNTAAPVPAAPSSNSGVLVPPRGPGPISGAPRAPALAQSPSRLPGVASGSSPHVASAPSLSPLVAASTAHAAAFTLTRTPGFCAIPSKTTVVPALPRFPHVANLRLPPASATSPLLSPAWLGSAAVPVSPVFTTAPTLTPVAVTPSTATQPHALGSVSAAAAASLPISLGSPLPRLPGLSSGSVQSPVISLPASLLSATGSKAAALPCSPVQQSAAVKTLGPAQQAVQTAVKMALPSAVYSQTPANTVITEKEAILKAALPCTLTPVRSAAAAPPVLGPVSRIHELPIAAIPPIGSTVKTFVTALGASGAREQPVRSLMTKATAELAAILTNPASRKDSADT